MALSDTPYLFTISKSTKKGKGRDGLRAEGNAAPELVPATGFNANKPSKTQVQLVDVVNQFEWTHTPAGGRHEVPFIRLSEYRVNFNSLMQNIRYLLSFVTEDSVGAAHQVDGGDLTTTEKISEGMRKTIAGVFNSKVVPKSIKNFPIDKSMQGSILKHSEYLHAYYGLYGVSPTGYDYYFPYFESEWRAQDSMWGDINIKGNIFSKYTQDLFGKEGLAADLGGNMMNQPDVVGTYVEYPKMYQYGTKEPAKKFSFSLMNTQTLDDVIRNWHLVFLLSYQNLPNKTSKILLDPPVMYEVEIPGIFYSPFAYISKLQITNRGAQRLMKIPYYSSGLAELDGELQADGQTDKSIGRWDNFLTGRIPRKTHSGNPLWGNLVKVTETGASPAGPGKPTVIETIIPDAYQVDITVQSLVPESKNLLYHSVLGPSTLNRGIYTATLFDPQMRKTGGPPEQLPEGNYGPLTEAQMDDAVNKYEIAAHQDKYGRGGGNANIPGIALQSDAWAGPFN